MTSPWARALFSSTIPWHRRLENARGALTRNSEYLEPLRRESLPTSAASTARHPMAKAPLQIRDIHGILRFMVHTLSGTRELILIDCV
jgi:hypothetical protein